MSKESKNAWLIAGLFLGFSVILLLFYAPFVGWLKISKSSQDWANFATYYTGIISPIVTTVGLYFIIGTFQLQQKQLNHLEVQNGFNIILATLERMIISIENSIKREIKREDGLHGLIEYIEIHQDFTHVHNNVFEGYLSSASQINTVFELINTSINFIQDTSSLGKNEPYQNISNFKNIVLQGRTKELRDIAKYFNRNKEIIKERGKNVAMGINRVYEIYVESFDNLLKTLEDFLYLTKAEISPSN